MSDGVMELFCELEEMDLLDDRREYSHEDLQKAYPFLGEAEVGRLYDLIQAEFE